MIKSRRFDEFRLLPVVAALSLAGLVGCGLLTKKGGDKADAEAVAETVDAAPPAAPEAIASNFDSVSRFADEQKLDNVAAPLQRSTNVREIPSIGKVVATLAKGANVSKIAQRGTAFLVLLDDPKAPKKLMGWVGQESFTAGADTMADPFLKALITCHAPEVPLISDAPFCGRICTSDAACPAGQACRGFANKLVKGKAAESVTLCTVFTPAKAAVAPPPVAANGGRASAPVAPAPSPAPPPTKALPDENRANGVQCSDAGQCSTFVCRGGVCKACVRDSECPTGLSRPVTCQAGACRFKPGTSSSSSDDDDDSSSSSSSDRGRDKPEPRKPEPKGLGEKCAFNGECKSNHCGTLSSGQLHKCVSKP